MYAPGAADRGTLGRASLRLCTTSILPLIPIAVVCRLWETDEGRAVVSLTVAVPVLIFSDSFESE